MRFNGCIHLGWRKKRPNICLRSLLTLADVDVCFFKIGEDLCGNCRLKGAHVRNCSYLSTLMRSVHMLLEKALWLDFEGKMVETLLGPGWLWWWRRSLHTYNFAPFRFCAIRSLRYFVMVSRCFISNLFSQVVCQVLFFFLSILPPSSACISFLNLRLKHAWW